MDQRSSERARTFLSGRIIFNNRASLIDCIVRDLSSGGARIAFEHPIDIPKEFELEIPRRNISAPARIIWSDAKEHGVTFLSEPRSPGRVYPSAGPESASDSRVDPQAIDPAANEEITSALTVSLADHLALYVRTRGLYWYMRNSGSAALRRVLDEQSRALLTAMDILAERVQELGGEGLLSLEQAAQLTHIPPDEAGASGTRAKIDALRSDNEALHAHLSTAYQMSGKHQDVASGALIDDLRAEADNRRSALARMRLDPRLS